MIIPYKQAIQEITDAINKSLAEMPDDETKIAVLNAFSRHMFYNGFKSDDNGDVDLLRKAQEPLGEKFEKVLHDNLWEMLEEDGEAQEK